MPAPVQVIWSPPPVPPPVPHRLPQAPAQAFWNLVPAPVGPAVLSGYIPTPVFLQPVVAATAQAFWNALAPPLIPLATPLFLEHPSAVPTLIPAAPGPPANPGSPDGEGGGHSRLTLDLPF